MCRQAGGGEGGARLGLGHHLCGVSEWGAQVGEAGGCAGTWRTWATSWFSPSLSWARLSLRALSLDKESRRDASSALSLVMDSSSSTRPASAYRVGTRAAKDIQARREGERKGEAGRDWERCTDVERQVRWGERQRDGERQEGREKQEEAGRDRTLRDGVGGRGRHETEQSL